MNKKVISIDVDGILADFYADICAIYNKEVSNITDFYVDWIGEIYEEVANDPKFWTEMSVLISPTEIEFEYDYYISALRDSMKGARQEWLDNNQYAPKPLHVSDDKHLLCDMLGVDIHIDDKLETVIKINEVCENTTAILHLPYYLEYDNIPEGTIVTRSIAELNEAIKTLIA